MALLVPGLYCVTDEVTFDMKLLIIDYILNITMLMYFLSTLVRVSHQNRKD